MTFRVKTKVRRFGVAFRNSVALLIIVTPVMMTAEPGAMKTCRSCHDSGTAAFPSMKRIASVDLATFIKTVREGRNAMPPQGLTDSEIAELFAYLHNANDKSPELAQPGSKAVASAFFPSISGGKAGQMEFLIQHRFGDGRNADTFLGMDQGANTRLGLDLFLWKELSVGLARTTSAKTYELHAALTVCQAKITWLSGISLIGAISQEEQEQYRPHDSYLRALPSTGDVTLDTELQAMNDNRNRLSDAERRSYLLTAFPTIHFYRIVTLRAGPVFEHRNFVRAGLKNDRWGFFAGGGLRITERFSIGIEGLFPRERDYVGESYKEASSHSYGNLKQFTESEINQKLTEAGGFEEVLLRNFIFAKKPLYKGNPLLFCFGIETGGHLFQILVSNTQNLYYGSLLTGAEFDLHKKHYSFGFNISRSFSL